MGCQWLQLAKGSLPTLNCSSIDCAGQSITRQSSSDAIASCPLAGFYADLQEEGLLLDALAVVAQPLAAVVGAISLEGCRAAGISPDQLTLRIDRPPYQLQLQLHQVSHHLACSACCINRTFENAQDRLL